MTSTVYDHKGKMKAAISQPKRDRSPILMIGLSIPHIQFLYKELYGKYGNTPISDLPMEVNDLLDAVSNASDLIRRKHPHWVLVKPEHNYQGWFVKIQ